MPQCVNHDRCQFFNVTLSEMPGMADIYRKNYCLGDSSKCARYIVFSKLGPGSVPARLWPNQHEDARVFLEEHGIAG